MPHDLYGKHELLSATEEVALARRIKAGGLDGQRARDEFVLANMRLVLHEAHRFSHRTSVSFEDLVQEATTGLIVAVDKFDPDRGFRFSTMATPWIIQRLQREVARSDSTIRLPGDARRIRLHAHAHPDMEVEELAVHFEMEPARVRVALRGAEVVASLDQPHETGGEPSLQVEDLDADDPAALAVMAADAEFVRALMWQLPADAREAVELRYGLADDGIEYTPTEIAALIGRRPVEVTRLLGQGVAALRELVTG